MKRLSKRQMLQTKRLAVTHTMTQTAHTQSQRMRTLSDGMVRPREVVGAVPAVLEFPETAQQCDINIAGYGP